MIGSIVIFGITYLAIATEKLDKTAAALLGASAAIMLHIVPYEVALHAIDMNVIFLLVGMMVSVNILASTGVFEWVAVKIAQQAKGNGLLILIFFLLATAVMSAFLDNVTTIILIAPITILISEILDLPAVPFLILEALASNIGGAGTLVGDPPNVIIASQTGLSFNEFIINMGPPVLVMLGGGVFMAVVFFKKQMTVPEANKVRIMEAKPEMAILDAPRLKRALAVFSLILVGFFVSHAVGIEPGIIALGGSLVMAIVCGADLHHALEKVEWASVFFFIGLFMLIGALEHNGVFEAMGLILTEYTQGNFLLTVMTVLWVSAILSAIVDNIPLVIAMLPLLASIIPVFGVEMGLSNDPEALRTQVAEPLYWSLALGACLGGNGSLVGASANVVVAQIARRNNYNLSFWAFTKYGLPTMLGTLVIASGYLYLRYFI